jgi:hypothetical protein
MGGKATWNWMILKAGIKHIPLPSSKEMKKTGRLWKH